MIRKILKRFIAFSLSVSMLPMYLNIPYKIATVNALTSADLSLSQNGVEFICERESFRSTCYRDNTQQSIGYGSKCGDGTLHANGTHSISQEKALAVMIEKVNNEYAPQVRKSTKGLQMTQNQFDALCSMCYNTWKISESPLVSYLKGELDETNARRLNEEYRICKGTEFEKGLRNRRRAEADLFFSGAPAPILPEPNEGCFPPCGSSYTSIVEALKSISVDSSYAYRERIAAANNISNYSGTAEQNTTMLNKLKSGSLRIPTEDTVIPPPPVIDTTEAYFPACSSSFTSLVDALKSIGVNSSYEYREKIAIANGISNYSGTGEQNTKLLTLLKAGKLINPDGKPILPDISGMYYPACDASYTSLADALKSIGEDGSYAHRKEIAIVNGISDYSGTADQNISLLTLLKNGKLIKSDYVAPPPIVDYIVTLDANKGTAPIAFMPIASNSVYNGLPTASREGYTFTGWYTTANGGKKITDGMSLVSASNHTIYANWTANKYVVTLNNNDGTGLSSQQTVIYDTAYGDLTAPTRTGYTFNGWYTDIIGGTKISSTSIHNVADNRTLYANWTPNKYSVSFDLNGGSGSFSAISVEYDGIYGDLPVPERAGHDFIGWFNAAENGVQISQNSRVEITSNQILYARWQQIVTTTTSTTTSTTSTTTTSTTTTTTTTAPVVTIKPDDVINDDDTAIIISDVKAEVGETVDISIDLSNNPGIASLGFELSYDPECVEFVDSVNGTIMGESYFECVNNPKNNIIFVQWINFENDITESGTILVLTFKVLDNVTSDTTKIGISCKNDNIKNLEDQIIPVKIKSGNITIGSENNIAGDANGDEVIDLKDVIIIRRYIAGGWNMDINTENADVNNDDKIDLKDVILIRRYIAGGWDIELV